jgi:hypothetical protein
MGSRSGGSRTHEARAHLALAPGKEHRVQGGIELLGVRFALDAQSLTARKPELSLPDAPAPAAFPSAPEPLNTAVDSPRCPIRFEGCPRGRRHRNPNPESSQLCGRGRARSPRESREAPKRREFRMIVLDTNVISECSCSMQLLRLSMPGLWSNERLRVVPFLWPMPRLRRCVEYTTAPWLRATSQTLNEPA